MIHFNELQDGKRYVADQELWLNKVAAHCQYALTLQTPIRTCTLTDANRQFRRQEITDSLRSFIQRFNREVTGNGWKRKDKFKPVFISAIEGIRPSADKNLTGHVHAALGNLPSGISKAELEKTIEVLWSNTRIGKADICLELLNFGTETRWTGYMAKESHVGNWECVSYETAQLPNFVLRTL
jgi:hypothetical protein